jgi:hypothetical protein
MIVNWNRWNFFSFANRSSQSSIYWNCFLSKGQAWTAERRYRRRVKFRFCDKCSRFWDNPSFYDNLCHRQKGIKASFWPHWLVFWLQFRWFFKEFFESPNRISSFITKIKHPKKSFQRYLLNILQMIVQRLCLCQEGLSHWFGELGFLIISGMYDSYPLVLLQLEGVHDDWTEVRTDLAGWYAFWEIAFSGVSWRLYS